MATRLIINADDFGLTEGVNRAITELHRAGVVTSTTLMATGPSFDHAVSLSTSLTTLGVGCHLVLVDGVPASPPEEIPTLLGADRQTFRPTLNQFVRDLLLGRIREEEIVREAEAQIRKLQRSGIHVTHVDTHKHTHLFPSVLRPTLLAARRCGVMAIRNPFEPHWSTALSRNHASRTRLLQLAVLHRFKPSFLHLLATDAAAITTNGTLGIAATGTLNAPALQKILSPSSLHADSDTIYELVCHPGYNDHDLDQTTTRLRTQRDVERQALLEQIPTRLSLPNPPLLVHYGNLVKR